MVVYKQPKPYHFTPEKPVEKHFHDHDETWIIMGGTCTAYMIDRMGKEEEFELTGGDVWMIEAGVEHGANPAPEGVHIFPFPGTFPKGSHEMGHYYMEKEGYMPSLRLVKNPIDRYEKK